MARTGDTLTPAELPEFICRELHDSVQDASITAPDPVNLASSLNLLVGELEPPYHRSARRRRAFMVQAAVVVTCVLLDAGLDRRIANDRTFAADAIAAAESAAAELGRSLAAPVSITCDSLPATLAAAKRSVEAMTRIGEPVDASSPLADLLNTWPRSNKGGWTSVIQSLSVTADQMSLTLTIDGDASAFLRCLTAPPGWTLREPRLGSVSRPVVPGTPGSLSLSHLTLVFSRDRISSELRLQEAMP